jgi:hypothetical protein
VTLANAEIIPAFTSLLEADIARLAQAMTRDPRLLAMARAARCFRAPLSAWDLGCALIQTPEPLFRNGCDPWHCACSRGNAPARGWPPPAAKGGGHRAPARVGPAPPDRGEAPDSQGRSQDPVAWAPRPIMNPLAKGWNPRYRGLSGALKMR